ncbi:hypothetical protein CsatB_007785 [Cannabis sativa]
MGRAPCCDKANVKKGPWSVEEDAKLKSYIENHGTGGNWIALPQKIGLKRCGKSCRLRWLNYLRPNIKHGGFSEEEDNIICSLYISIGSSQKTYWPELPVLTPPTYSSNGAGQPSNNYNDHSSSIRKLLTNLEGRFPDHHRDFYNNTTHTDHHPLLLHLPSSAPPLLSKPTPQLSPPPPPPQVSLSYNITDAGYGFDAQQMLEKGQSSSSSQHDQLQVQDEDRAVIISGIYDNIPNQDAPVPDGLEFLYVDQEDSRGSSVKEKTAAGGGIIINDMDMGWNDEMISSMVYSTSTSNNKFVSDHHHDHQSLQHDHSMSFLPIDQ